MNGNKYLLDTNILIYLSKNELKLEDFANSADSLYISVISIMEAKGFPFSNQQEEKIISAICDNLIKVGITDQIVDTVISLRKKSRLKLPDAIILASAIENNLTLVTRNTKDFDYQETNNTILNPFLK